MMNRSHALAVSLVLLLGSSVASATVSYTFQPDPPDLYDLDHWKVYLWGIERAWDLSATPVAATLTFHDIRNWADEPNVLYLRLGDDAPLGVSTWLDFQFSGDALSGWGQRLTIYRDLPTTPQDLTYEFTAQQVLALADYASDGVFALGFEPDCHFYNGGVELEVFTGQVIPEPATLATVVIGGGLLLVRRRRR